MFKRKWFYLIGLSLLCAAFAGVRFYNSKCHDVDACAAQSAEGHERDTPTEAQ
jgi:hypothetical protein